MRRPWCLLPAWLGDDNFGIIPVSPFSPGTDIVSDARIAKGLEGEQRVCRAVTSMTDGNDGLVRGYPFGDVEIADLARRSKSAPFVQVIAPENVHRPGNGSGSPRALLGAAVLRLAPDIDYHGAFVADGAMDIEPGGQQLEILRSLEWRWRRRSSCRVDRRRRLRKADQAIARCAPGLCPAV